MLHIKLELLEQEDYKSWQPPHAQSSYFNILRTLQRQERP